MADLRIELSRNDLKSAIIQWVTENYPNMKVTEDNVYLEIRESFNAVDVSGGAEYPTVVGVVSMSDQ